MNSLHRDAILKASEIRKKLGANMFQPVNIYDSCIKLGVDVKFIDVNMEGLFVNQGNSSLLLISNMRPFPRRCFTCAHELGHHVFNHGLKVDILSDEHGNSTSNSMDEMLADAFAAALLMPIGGIQAEFAKRGWNFQDASPIDYYIICSVFGVGYQTLIIHCKINGLISETKAGALLKLTPGKIFKNQFGNIGANSYFKIIDEHSDVQTIDLEVENYVVLPISIQTECEYLEKVVTTEKSNIYIAKKAGISTGYSSDGKNSYFIRIQKESYTGFAEYRHFEN